MRIIVNFPGFSEKSIYFSDNSVRTKNNKDVSWFKNGKMHRENDLPACINDDIQQWMSKYKSAKVYAKNGRWEIRF